MIIIRQHHNEFHFVGLWQIVYFCWHIYRAVASQTDDRLRL
jgi:hypothetical protein